MRLAVVGCPLLFSCVLGLLQNKVQISGIRNKQEDGELNTMPVGDRQPFAVQVFGSALPSKGFYFTTADQCEDNQRIDLNDVYYNATNAKSFDKYALLEMDQGLPFDEPSRSYRLCNHNFDNNHSEKFLKVWRVSDRGEPTGIYILCLYCLLASGYGAGMTIAYMKHTITDLERMIKGDEPMKTRARRILKLRKRSNLLVCALATFATVHNVIFTLKVGQHFTKHKYGDTLSVLVPTAFLFFFAEIIPQALCNSSFGVVLAYATWPLTTIIVIVVSPIAWPLSKLIDNILGRDVRQVMTAEEKENIIRIMSKKLNPTEANILQRAAVFSEKNVGYVMTPMENVFLLSNTQRLDKSTMLIIFEKGFTRIPVYKKHKDKIYMVLNVKDLVCADLSKCPTVADIVCKLEGPTTQMRYAPSEMQALQLMQDMRRGAFHICAVQKFIRSRYRLVGIITFEDVLEELVGEIEDEKDRTRPTKSAGMSRDMIVIDWHREAGTNLTYPLEATEQLLVIQTMLATCSAMVKLGINVLHAKLLLAPHLIQTANAEESLPNRQLIVVYEGDVVFSHAGIKTEVRARRSMTSLTTTVTTKTPEGNADATAESATTPIDQPCIVFGKGLLARVLQQVALDPSCADKWLAEQDEEYVIAKSTVSYFKITAQHILEVLQLVQSDVSRFNDVYNVIDPKTKTTRNALAMSPKSPSRPAVSPSSSQDTVVGRSPEAAPMSSAPNSKEEITAVGSREPPSTLRPPHVASKKVSTSKESAKRSTSRSPVPRSPPLEKTQPSDSENSSENRSQ